MLKTILGTCNNIMAALMNRFGYASSMIIAALTFFVAENSHAFTSIAVIEGRAGESIYYFANNDSQKEADRFAIKGCRDTARNNGLGKLASKCKVVTRAKQPGYGVIVCGDDGCAWGTGYESAQAAVDAISIACNESYKNCRTQNVTSWWEDYAGFMTKPVSRKNGKSCAPEGKYTCTQHCNNNQCQVKFNNGCIMNVVVGQHQELKTTLEYNPSSGKHEWLSKWVWVNDDPCRYAAGY